MDNNIVPTNVEQPVTPVIDNNVQPTVPVQPQVSAQPIVAVQPQVSVQPTVAVQPTGVENVENTNEPKIVSSTTDIQATAEANIPDDTVTDEELLKAYIGDSYDSFLNKKFNIGAFFLTGIYCFYRKMIVYGAIICVVELILSLAKILSLLSIGICIAAGIYGNRIYLNYAKKHIEKIKASNPGMARDQLLDVCRHDGGVSTVYAIGLTVVIAVIFNIIKKMIFGA